MILFIPKKEIVKFMQQNENIMLNIINIISNRSNFLSKKIKLLTLMALTPFLINATEIICAGQGNQGELIEIELNYFDL